MANQRTFSDIDMSFTPHPDTGDIMKVYDANSVMASVRHLVLTAFYERPFHPEIGSSIAGLLFEHQTPLVDEAIERTIFDIIDNFEPRATVQNVSVTFNDGDNGYYVEVQVFLQALMQEVNVDFLLERVR